MPNPRPTYFRLLARGKLTITFPTITWTVEPRLLDHTGGHYLFADSSAWSGLRMAGPFPTQERLERACYETGIPLEHRNARGVMLTQLLIRQLVKEGRAEYIPDPHASCAALT